MTTTGTSLRKATALRKDAKFLSTPKRDRQIRAQEVEFETNDYDFEPKALSRTKAMLLKTVALVQTSSLLRLRPMDASLRQRSAVVGVVEARARARRAHSGTLGAPED